MFWIRTSLIVFSLIGLAACSSESSRPYENHSALIDTKTWINDHADLEPFIYVDLRSAELFKEGHLPKAINITRSAITKKHSPYSGMAMSADSLAIVLGNNGISSNDWLILYDEKGGVEASRLWWLLRVYGHEKVKILNGDLKLFEDDLEFETTRRAPTAFEFTGKPHPDWIVNYEEFERLRTNPSIKILDCRSAEEFEGEYIKPGAYLAGHIQGAENICYSNTVNQIDLGNLKIKSPQELSKVYSNFAQDQDTILVYCHSGVRSAHTLLVLREILGYEHVYNYDGSWVEWSYLNQNRSEDSLLLNTKML